jgi:hypothetical protein
MFDLAALVSVENHQRLEAITPHLALAQLIGDELAEKEPN